MKINDQRSLVVCKALSSISKIDDGVYIMGTNKYGLEVKKWMESNNIIVHGFINDYMQESFFENEPVLRSYEVPANNVLINCVIEGRTVDAQEKLLTLQPSQVIDYFALQLAFPDQLMQIDFLENTDSILEDSPQYINLYNKLEDEESKEVLFKLINFRLNRDIDYLYGFNFKIRDQYFEPFFSLKKNPVFNFANIYPEYDSVHIFEPNKEIVSSAKSNIKDLKNIKFYEKGLWNESTMLHFDGSKGGASKVSIKGGSSITTVALDELPCLDYADFIKLDIEGAELNALKGAKNIIQKSKPILAICVYHSQNDFLDIPRLVSTFRSDYKIYLRHYTQGVFETVMYFV
jgi:FkbM family methyltransferase